MRGGVGSIIVKAGSVGAAFLITVVLARELGTDGYGVYAFIFSVITILAIPAQAGLPQLLVRETAQAHAADNTSLIYGLWRWADRFSIKASAAIIVVCALFLWAGNQWLSQARWETLMFALPLIPLLALVEVRGAALRGLRHTVIGQIPPRILRPVFFVFLLVIVVSVFPAYSLSPHVAMALHVVAALLALSVGMIAVIWLKPYSSARKPIPLYRLREWRRAALPLAFLSSLQLINQQTDLIMIGLLRSDGDVGVYRAVFQLSLLVVFGLQAANQVIQPYVARIHVEGSVKQLQRLVTISARVILMFALPPVAVMFFWGETVLIWLFGADYQFGSTALAILAIGQLINAGMGSTGALLNMTGHERDTVEGVVIATASNVILNIILIPLYGINGAACASLISLSVWNIILRRRAQQRLGIETIAFARL